MAEERRDAAEDQGQMKDQEPFSEDPREGKKLSEQQGESQPADSGSGPRPSPALRPFREMVIKQVFLGDHFSEGPHRRVRRRMPGA
jgi:hypothetical protein